jgi:hypothetical protein
MPERKYKLPAYSRLNEPAGSKMATQTNWL